MASLKAVQSAKNLVCARAYGVASDVIAAYWSQTRRDGYDEEVVAPAYV